uniref:PKS_ER domain-containing protein n=1 Tax=Steinernema glaseri TaxID=37863 RepID=A0A1I7ZQ67_9BILA
MFASTRSALLTKAGETLRRGAIRNYRAAVLKATGHNLVIDDLKSKPPRHDEILVAVESAGFNFADINMINGKYHLRPMLPFVPGYELAGCVKAVGSKVERFKEGDRIMAVRTNGTGAFAEECVIHQDELIFKIPYSIDFDTAAALPVSYGSAYLALKSMASQRRGHSVLVLSSRGTVGFAAIDLAQNVFECKVFGASDTEEKLDKLRETGIQSTINYTDGDMTSVVKKKTFGKGVDVVIDTVGGVPCQQALESLKNGGELISLGFSSGEVPSINMLDLHRLQATVTGVWLGGRTHDEMESIMETLIGMVDEGYISCHIERKYSLEEVNECVSDVTDDKVFGKAVITMK